MFKQLLWYGMAHLINANHRFYKNFSLVCCALNNNKGQLHFFIVYNTKSILICYQKFIKLNGSLLEQF